MRRSVKSVGVALVLAVLGSSVSDAARAQSATRYAPPKSEAEFRAWPRAKNIMRVQRSGDPGSPRSYNGYTGPKFNVRSFDAAVADVVKDTDLRLVGPPRLEKLEAWSQFDGRDVRLLLAETRLNGAPGVLFMKIARLKGSNDYQILGLEAPRDTFVAWGGAVRMLQLRGIIPSVESFPAARRAQIARAPLPQQVALYEQALNKQYTSLAAGLMASQAQTLMRMRELNYDLLFGNDITDPGIGSNRRR